MRDRALQALLALAVLLVIAAIVLLKLTQ